MIHPKLRYQVRAGHYFDRGRPVHLVCDLRPEMSVGMFEGFHNGMIDQNLYPFEDFEYLGVEGEDSVITDDAFFLKEQENGSPLA